jgi:hypothetical protein
MGRDEAHGFLLREANFFDVHSKGSVSVDTETKVRWPPYTSPAKSYRLQD